VILGGAGFFREETKVVRRVAEWLPMRRTLVPDASGAPLFGLIAPTLLAVLAALLSGGSMTHWARARLRWSPLGLIALGVQIPLCSAPFTTWPVVVAIGAGTGIATTAPVLLLLARNARGPLRLAGGLAALGIVLNPMVMLLSLGAAGCAFAISRGRLPLETGRVAC
jgi:hypothetical protein